MQAQQLNLVTWKTRTKCPGTSTRNGAPCSRGIGSPFISQAKRTSLTQENEATKSQQQGNRAGSMSVDGLAGLHSKTHLYSLTALWNGMDASKGSSSPVNCTCSAVSLSYPTARNTSDSHTPPHLAVLMAPTSHFRPWVCPNSSYVFLRLPAHCRVMTVSACNIREEHAG